MSNIQSSNLLDSLRLLLFAATLWMLMPSFVVASDVEVIRFDEHGTRPLYEHLEYWVPEQGISIEEAASEVNASRYMPLSEKSESNLNKDIWYRFQVSASNTMYWQLVLNFNEILFDEIDVYYQREGKWQTYKTGLRLGLDSHPLGYRLFAFPFVVPAEEVSTIYFRIHHLPNAMVKPYLQTHEEHFKSSISQTIISMLVVGALMSMIFYMLMVPRPFLTGWEIFSFVGFIGSILLTILFFDGYLGYVFSGFPNVHVYAHVVVSALTNIFSLLFLLNFYNIKSSMPVIFYCSRVMVVMFCAIIIVTFFKGPESIGGSFSMFSAVVLLILLVAAFRAVFMKLNFSKYYLFAIVSYVFSVAYTALASLDVLPFNFHSRSYIYLGAFSFALFSTLAVSRKLKAFRDKAVELEKSSAAIEARNNAKSMFLATMSHEIRTPINGIFGMSQLLGKTKMDSTQRYYINILISAVNSLLNVVNDILDISKIESGKMEVEKSGFNLDRLLTYSTTIFNQANMDKDIVFSLNVDTDIPIYLVGDEPRLQQIINNLLSNAFKFTETGSIDFDVSLVGSAGDSVDVLFSVKDTGIGISNEQMRQLFEPYTQADHSTTRKYGGTGLGLSIYYRLVQLMGGTMGVESQEGEGSNFWFQISFDVDREKSSLLQKQLDELPELRIAVVTYNPKYLKHILNYLDKFKIAYDIVEPAGLSEDASLSGNNFLFINNAMGDLTRSWVDYASTNNIAFLLIDSVADNVFWNDDDLTGVKRVRLPSGIENIIELLSESHRKENDKVEGIQNTDQENQLYSGVKILVAEDNEVNTQVIRAMLGQYGVDADFVGNGEQAVSAVVAGKNRYDAILMDCEMPVLDGYRATESIRKYERDNNVPPIYICALTAHAMQETKDRCSDAGMDEVLTKPLRIESLEGFFQSVIKSKIRLVGGK